MEKIILFLPIICVLCSCQSAEKSPSLVLNLEQAERFIDVMDYLEASDSSGFTKVGLSDEMISQNFAVNNMDTVLNRKIDSLLSLSAYDDFSKITSALVNDTTYRGKDAYRMAFLSLPKTRIRMSADMPETWATFWEKNHDARASAALKEIKREQKQLTEKALSVSGQLLPKDIILPATTDLIICLDGNRGSFTTEDQIFMDMFGFNTTEFNIDRFAAVVTHELHHILYGYWFSEQVSSKNRSEKEEALFEFMKPIIFEGIAQQIDYNSKPDEVKRLYHNKELIEELFEGMLTSIRKIASSNNPLKTYEEEENKIWANKVFYLKKYHPGGYQESIVPNAPTLVYYLGYQLYNSILQQGGKERLDFVIENFDCLLEEYNKIYSSDLLIPKIPDDIVKLWKESFKKQPLNTHQASFIKHDLPAMYSINLWRHAVKKVLLF